MTKIEWADETRNFQSGCTEARYDDGSMSPECVNCYARLMSARQESMGTKLYAGSARRVGGSAVWTGKIQWSEEKLLKIFDEFKSGKLANKRVFLGSMTDLFHDDADPFMLKTLAEQIEIAGYVPKECLPRVIILTKRSKNLLSFQRKYFPSGLPFWIWPGVTAGTQKSADERVEDLLNVRTYGIRVVSMEPLLGMVDISGWAIDSEDSFPLDRIGWVITGGESGHKARPSHPDWFRFVRDQCVNSGVPYFHKQNGEWTPRIEGIEFVQDVHDSKYIYNTEMIRVGKKNAGRLLDGVEWSQVPNGAP